MVNKKILLGMLVMILVFGMTVIGCDNGTTDSDNDETSPLDGTWISTTKDINTDSYFKIIASGGNFTESIASSQTAATWKEVVKGTYVKNAKSPVTGSVTEVNTVMFGDTDEWKTWANLGQYQGYVSQTVTFTISDNQFTTSGITFERK